MSQGEAFTLASISYLAILVKYILAKTNLNAPTPEVVDNVGLSDSPRSQTGDVDRAMLGHSNPKQLDSTVDMPYQSMIAARHPLSFSSIIFFVTYPISFSFSFCSCCQ